MRARRVRPVSVRTTAAGITPPAIASTVAISPAYRPLRILTRAPGATDARPASAVRSIDTVRFDGLRGSAVPNTGGGPFVAVFGGGYVTFRRRTR